MDAALGATALLECARELVRVPSESPSGDERAAVAAIRPQLDALGCQVAEIEPAPGRVSLVATLDSGRPGPTLAVNGHLDVVSAGPLDAWEHPPHEATVADGILHGRGAMAKLVPVRPGQLLTCVYTRHAAHASRSGLEAG
jgi:acetylornithine deacetylase/succinyl-diaminopimelate desuccinylase-like protein